MSEPMMDRQTSSFIIDEQSNIYITGTFDQIPNSSNIFYPQKRDRIKLVK